MVESYLDRIDALNPGLGAVVTVAAESARAQAREADRCLARGEDLGPLHGLPVTVKDSLETAGMRTTCGARELADYVPDNDAVAVGRLRRAGAIIVGKTNLPAWASDCQSYNELFGTTNNPWDASGLEWETTSPPPTFNFDETPVVTAEPYAYSPERSEDVYAAAGHEPAIAR